MATVEYAKDTSLSVASDGMKRTREKLITAASVEEIISQNLLPEYGSRHPENILFRFTDGSIQQVGNSDNTLQWLFTGTYSTSSGSGGSDNSDVDPWDLAAQEFNRDYFTISAPVFNLRNKSGQLVPFMNSANCRMQAQRDIYGVEYSFIYCLKYKESSTPNIPSQPIINSQTTKVAGEDLPAYSSLLFPPQMRLVTDRKDDGTIKRSYWEISVKIRKHPHSNGWFEDYPDVGTLALDANGDPAPIYRYSPWTTNNPDTNSTIAPAFGTIQQVIAAKHAYATGCGYSRNDENTAEKYWQAWQELPYEEMTEPLPLLNGKVYLNAMKDPATYPYQQITGTVHQLGDFTQFDLPSNREA